MSPSVKIAESPAPEVLPVRHVLGLSGGKDSAALAVYLRQKGTVPNMEYFFSDTGKELPEVYNFLDRLESHLGSPIARLSAERDFDHHLKTHGGMLPSARLRWCTHRLKLRPFEEFVGTDPAISYIGIRADEHRKGYISTKPNIRARFPFIEDGLVREDIFRLLRETVGVPEYYEWRSRSGCYFCFFQRKEEWVGLLRRHPDLYRKAMAYERFDPETGRRFTWTPTESLAELAARAGEIEEKAVRMKKPGDKRNWREILLAEEDEDDPEERACLVCSL